MKTCVLFPNTLNTKYIDGSVAHSMNVRRSQELHLSPQDLYSTVPSGRKLRNGLSLFSLNGQKREIEKPRLLHVEDSPQIRLLVSVFLRGEFEVESVTTGEEGVQKAKENQYDIILMDINLGKGIDGFQATAKIRETHKHRDIPIIALTSNKFKDVRQQCITSKMNAYIQKPFDKMYLLGAIREINKHRAQKQLN